MSKKLLGWLAAEIGPRWPIIHVQRCEIFGWHWWTTPGLRHNRAEILLMGFIVAMAALT